ILGCAMWCGPCQQEQPQLVAMANQYAAGDVAFFEGLGQDGALHPADLHDVTTWSERFELPFLVGADPELVLAPYFLQPAYPMQMVVRTSDMTILWQDVGADAAMLKAQIDAALASP